jgi:hypothetical protein
MAQRSDVTNWTRGCGSLLSVAQRTDGVCRLGYLLQTLHTRVTVEDWKAYHAISVAILYAYLRAAGLCDYDLQFNL